MSAGSDPVVLFDGLCGFCDGAVQLLLKLDRRGVLRFAPLQGETAAPWVARVPAGTDSILLVEGDRVTWRSEAALRIAGHLGWPWRAAVALRIVPRFLRDAVYDAIARARYRLAGRRQACRMPTPGERARFLP